MRGQCSRKATRDQSRPLVTGRPVMAREFDDSIKVSMDTGYQRCWWWWWWRGARRNKFIATRHQWLHSLQSGSHSTWFESGCVRAGGRHIPSQTTTTCSSRVRKRKTTNASTKTPSFSPCGHDLKKLNAFEGDALPRQRSSIRRPKWVGRVNLTYARTRKKICRLSNHFVQWTQT